MKKETLAPDLNGICNVSSQKMSIQICFPHFNYHIKITARTERDAHDGIVKTY